MPHTTPHGQRSSDHDGKHRSTKAAYPAGVAADNYYPANHGTSDTSTTSQTKATPTTCDPNTDTAQADAQATEAQAGSSEQSSPTHTGRENNAYPTGDNPTRGLLAVDTPPPLDLSEPRTHGRTDPRRGGHNNAH